MKYVNINDCDCLVSDGVTKTILKYVNISDCDCVVSDGVTKTI
jgi:predicted metallopeptidase